MKIAASGVCLLDTEIRASRRPKPSNPFPQSLVLIWPVRWSAVAKFKTGDEVYGMVGGVGGLQGTWRSTSRPTQLYWR